jgi:hypothetical protein
MRIKSRLFLITVLFLVMMAPAISHFARTSEHSATVSPPHSPATRSTATLSVQQNPGASEAAPSDIRVVLLSLRPEGFEPGELQLTAGEYLLIVRNRTGLSEIKVRLQSEAGERMGEATVRARQRDWKQRLRLAPGVYLLTATDHPDWICRIVVNR